MFESGNAGVNPVPTKYSKMVMFSKDVCKGSGSLVGV